MRQRVLILSASAGAGHVRAGDALQKAFKVHPDVEDVQHWDMLKYTTKIFRHLYGQLYLDLINKAPRMLGWFYEMSDVPWKNEKSRLAFEKLNARRFIDAVTSYQPTLVVCTHFTPAATIAWLNETRKLTVQQAITVTDFDCHAMWLTHHYVRYFVALEETRVYLDRMGIPAEKVTVSGIPIDPIFAQQKDKRELRAKYGLDPERFSILVSAGGYGVGPVEHLISELLQLKHEAQIIAIAGRSEELKAKLDQVAARFNNEGHVRLHPFGYTTDMDEFMTAADILVGKPGGLTTSEALSKALPICIVNPIPGQEERNSDHLLEEGVAIRCNNQPALAYKLDNLINDAARLESMRRNARRLGNANASATIVKTLLG